MGREGNEMVYSFASRQHYFTFKKFHTVNVMYYLAGEEQEWKSDLWCSLLFPVATDVEGIDGDFVKTLSALVYPFV